MPDPVEVRYEVFSVYQGSIRVPDSAFFEEGVFYRWIIEGDQAPRIVRELPERQLLLTIVTQALKSTCADLSVERSTPHAGEDGDVAQSFLNYVVERLEQSGWGAPALCDISVQHDRRIGLRADD